RLDLVVAQNGAETKLYRNVTGRPVLRVRVKGPPENPLGIGAVLQVSANGRKGPIREIHAGAGYWSQDSVVQLLHLPDEPAEMAVRWPGGKSNSFPIPDRAREIEVSAEGVKKLL